MKTYKTFFVTVTVILIFMILCGISANLKHRQKMWEARQMKQIEIMLDNMRGL